jgi:hypothetical protein
MRRPVMAEKVRMFSRMFQSVLEGITCHNFDPTSSFWFKQRGK